VAYHNFTSMVGAGVLALPSVMAGLGWGFGTVALFLSWFISWMTFVFLVKVGDILGVRGVVKATVRAVFARFDLFLPSPFSSPSTAARTRRAARRHAHGPVPAADAVRVWQKVG
jgi:Transmembrane amino acid transporter protein